MVLRKDMDQLMERIEKFTTPGKTGDALIFTRLAGQNYKIKGLNQWNFPKEMHAFLDECIIGLEYAWHQREGIEDDEIPCISPRYGIAEHSAFAAGEVKFSEDTSWTHPVIRNWMDVKKIELREDNPWFKMVIDGLAYLKEKSEGRFAVKLRGGFAPLDLANALRGNDIFTDFYDAPEELHNLLEFCVNASQWYLDHQLKVVGDFNGGTITGTGVWLPGNSIGHLSEDATVMCSPSLYREFGQPYTQKLVEKYDHAFMHLHSAGTHCYNQITKISKIDYFDIVNDPNKPAGIDVYREYFGLFKNKIVLLTVTFDEIKENINLLKKGKTILICNAKNIEEANAVIRYVRHELPVYDSTK